LRLLGLGRLLAGQQVVDPASKDVDGLSAGHRIGFAARLVYELEGWRPCEAQCLRGRHALLHAGVETTHRS
jgi:hypothetical protein